MAQYHAGDAPDIGDELWRLHARIGKEAATVHCVRCKKRPKRLRIDVHRKSVP